MNRNVLYLVIAVLVVAAGVMGYQLYNERHKSGVEIEVGKSGLSIQQK
jgi:predicted negative regulator of RcsB-dependent stress response